MEKISKKLTGQKIYDEMLKQNMTVRDLQEALELNCPQSIYKWFYGASLPSLQNMLILGKLFRVPVETLVVYEEGSSAFHRAFYGHLPIQIGLLFESSEDLSLKRRSNAKLIHFRQWLTSK